MQASWWCQHGLASCMPYLVSQGSRASVIAMQPQMAQADSERQQNKSYHIQSGQVGQLHWLEANPLRRSEPLGSKPSESLEAAFTADRWSPRDYEQVTCSICTGLSSPEHLYNIAFCPANRAFLCSQCLATPLTAAEVTTSDVHHLCWRRQTHNTHTSISTTAVTLLFVTCCCAALCCCTPLCQCFAHSFSCPMF